ncbi:hypothetical protein PHPALM_28032 [Phytophthora palmivora]|uniref:Uncharacterized protein n=1 Tax=Phytophthora palmivora TaxID=4796 RepID=A0A2P4XB41_9STRA|nr:hypothetical protein PHPALM_28032 [Phytophthora palmivora]
MLSTPRSSINRTYTKALVFALNIGNKSGADFLNYPGRTVQDWIRQRDAIFDFKGAQTNKTLIKPGRKEVAPFAHGHLTFMKDMRRNEEVTVVHYDDIKTNHRCWLSNYVMGKKSIVSADIAIMRLLQRFFHILAERDRKGSAKEKYTEKHWSRLTAAMTIRADGKPGGTIEMGELRTYPQGQGQVYCVQENSWMDSRVWEIYAKELLKFK